MNSYEEFLNTKITLAVQSGFEPNEAAYDVSLKPHQVDAVTWALRLGKALIAMSFGLGKSRIQCQIAIEIVKLLGGKFLVVCPLGVKHQFADEDGPAMGMVWEYVRNDQEIEAATSPYLITNYERVRDGNIDPTRHNLSGVSLDEGSVLRSLGSITSDVFRKVFAKIPYRYVCTATPSPNNFKELIYYAEFLGVMDHGQALTRFFKRDTAKAGNLKLMPSQERDFWMWVASWALFVSKPSDLGYSDEGYSLPAMRIHWQRLGVDHTRAWEQMDDRGQRRIILDASSGVSEASAEKRETLPVRLAEMQRIMAENPGRHWLLWHHLEAERTAIEKAVPEAVTVFGSQTLEEREKGILDFSRGLIPILATKPEIAGAGCNFQKYCHSAIFLGIEYKFQDTIQAVHRLYRFMQNHEVDVWFIYAESEDAVVDVLKRKWKQHDELVANMQKIIWEYGLSTQAIQVGLSRHIGVNRMEVKGDLFTAIHNDCVQEVKRLPDNSIDLWHTSIPFGNHYEYTTNYEDFGHNKSDEAFWEQMDFLIPEMLRTLKPGRVAAIHVKDRQLYGHQTASGIMETAPFSDECVMAFRKHGWTYQGRRTIATDVVRENNQTYRLSYGEMLKDASKMSQGLPEYLLLFRKPPSSNENARADEPVIKNKDEYGLGRWQVDANGVWRTSSNRPLTPAELVDRYALPEQLALAFREEQKSGFYDYERHVQICEELHKRGRLPKFFMLLPPKVTRNDADMVWDDVVFMRSLNAAQAQKRKENHICPLPFDIVDRTIRLYSNPGEVVGDPFGGLGTVGYCAILQKRRAWLCELNADYFTAQTQYLKAAEEKVKAPMLFDMDIFSTVGTIEAVND
jgi:DNA modification methylase